MVRAGDVTGAILAGGRGSRAGGRDKGLIDSDGEPAVVRVARGLRAQVARIVVSANRNVERYASLGFETIADDVAGFAGPLAGIAAIAARVESPWLLTVPVDCDEVPAQLLTTLAAAASDEAGVYVAHDGVRRQPMFALYRIAAARAAATAPVGEAVWRFQDRQRCREVRFAAGTRFANRNHEGASC